MSWRQTVRSWHGGQLVIAWVALAGACGALHLVGWVVHETFLENASNSTEAVVMVSLLVIPPVLASVAALVLTWVWLGARSPRREGP